MFQLAIIFFFYVLVVLIKLSYAQALVVNNLKY